MEVTKLSMKALQLHKIENMAYLTFGNSVIR